MILLKSLKLHNFLSHEDTQVSFSENTKTLFDGNSGSGKSSILEAIIWCLYGTGRSDNKSLIQKGSKKAIVLLELSHDDKTYEIERSVTSAGKHTLEVRENGIAHELTGVKVLQEWIEREFIGASYLLFVNSIAYLQNGADTFVTQSASKRKELLLEIVKMDNFDALYEKTRQFIAQKETKLAVKDNEIKTDTLWLEETTKKITEKTSFESKLTQTKETIASLQERLYSMTIKEAEYKTLENRLQDIKKTVLSLQDGLKTLTNDLQEAHTHKVELSHLIDIEASLQPLQSEIEVLDIKIKEGEDTYQVLNEKIQKANELMRVKPIVIDRNEELIRLDIEARELADKPNCPAGDLCPYMSDKTTRLDRLQNNIVQLTVSLVKQTNDLKEWEKEYNSYNFPSTKDTSDCLISINNNRGKRDEILKDLHKKELALSLKQTHEKIIEGIPEKEEQIKQQKQKIEESQRQHTELMDGLNGGEHLLLVSEIRKLKDEIGRTRDEETRLVSEINFIEKLVSSIITVQTNLTARKKETSIIKKQIEKVSLLKEAFGSKGIKTIAVDYLIPNLEEKINEILSQLSDFQIRLDTQQTKTSGDGNKEGLFITIINGINEEMPYENLSGGEQTKVIVAFSEALATLQKCGFRIFDEFVTALDENSLEHFMEAIEHLQQRYPQMLMVTHIQAIKDMFDEQISIIKHNGISNVTR